MTAVPLCEDVVRNAQQALHVNSPSSDTVMRAKRAVTRFCKEIPALEVNDELVSLYMALRMASKKDGSRITAAMLQSWQSRLQIENVATRTVWVQDTSKLETPLSKLRKYIIPPESVELPPGFAMSGREARPQEPMVSEVLSVLFWCGG